MGTAPRSGAGPFQNGRRSLLYTVLMRDSGCGSSKEPRIHGSYSEPAKHHGSVLSLCFHLFPLHACDCCFVTRVGLLFIIRRFGVIPTCVQVVCIGTGTRMYINTYVCMFIYGPWYCTCKVSSAGRWES